MIVAQPLALGLLARCRQVLRQPGAAPQGIVQHEFAHKGAAALTDLHMTFARQRLHRLAQRVAVDAKALGQHEFVGQSLAGCVPAAQNVFAQRVGDGLPARRRAALRRSAGRRWRRGLGHRRKCGVCGGVKNLSRVGLILSCLSKSSR